MIKDVFVLKKNSWHMKLMKWIWGWDHRDFSNMCPYFWLTLANLFIAPFKGIYVSVITLSVAISEAAKPYIQKLDEYYEKKCEEAKEKWYDKYLNKLDELLFKEEINENELKVLDKFVNSRGNPKDIQYWELYHHKLDYDKRQELRNRYYDAEYRFRMKQEEQQQIKEREKQKIVQNNRQVIGKMIPTIKLIFKGLGILLGLGVLYLLYLLILWIGTWNWALIGEKTLAVIIGTAFMCIIIGILFLLYKLLSKVFVKFWCAFSTYCIPCEENREKIGDGFSFVGKVIAYPFVKTWRGLVILKDIIVALKQNNCPAIDWED